MNKRTLFGLIAIVCLALAATTFSLMADETAAPPKTSGLVDDLTSKLSLKPEQATGAAGAVFSLAKSKLTPEDFGKIAAGIPEMDTLLKAAPPAPTSGAASAIAGAMGSKGGSAALLSQFNSLGISPESAAKVVPEVLSFVKGKQGDKVTDLLSKAIK
jgi:Protein of unknown function VcgC/VcgE (DUF2780)